MVDYAEQLKRVYIISENLKKPLFVWINPISEIMEAYIDLVDYKPPNPNVNYYVELSGKDITDYLNDKWYSINVDQKFDDVLASQKFEFLPKTQLNFSADYKEWMWVNKN